MRLIACFLAMVKTRRSLIFDAFCSKCLIRGSKSVKDVKGSVSAEGATGDFEVKRISRGGPPSGCYLKV